MHRARLTVGWLAVLTSLLIAPALSQEAVQKIDVGGRKLRVQIEGQAREGQLLRLFPTSRLSSSWEPNMICLPRC